MVRHHTDCQELFIYPTLHHLWAILQPHRHYFSSESTTSPFFASGPSHMLVPLSGTLLSTLCGWILPLFLSSPKSYLFREIILLLVSYDIWSFFTENTIIYNYFVYLSVFYLFHCNQISPYNFIYCYKPVPSTVPDT